MKAYKVEYRNPDTALANRSPAYREHKGNAHPSRKQWLEKFYTLWFEAFPEPDHQHEQAAGGTIPPDGGHLNARQKRMKVNILGLSHSCMHILLMFN